MVEQGHSLREREILRVERELALDFGQKRVKLMEASEMMRSN